MLPLFQKNLLPETLEVPPHVIAQIVHRFMVKVQVYTDRTIEQKHAEWVERGGKDRVLLSKLEAWRTYRRFNAIALEEIESGELDEWFRTLFSEKTPSDRA